MGRVGSYPTFSLLLRRLSRINSPITASGNGHTMRGTASPHRTRIRWASMGPQLGEKRHISVALVLGSPPAGVTRYPCPVEPGLSSPEPFRVSAAAVRPSRRNIVQQAKPIVKYLAKSFVNGYTIK